MGEGSGEAQRESDTEGRCRNHRGTERIEGREGGERETGGRGEGGRGEGGRG